MARKRWLIIGLASASSLAVGLAVGYVSGWLSRRPYPPNLDDPQSWITIKHFEGELNPGDEKVRVDVSVLYRLSDDRYPYTIFQNKIEVHKGSYSYRFMWPDDKTFAAGWCEIVDVDGDGLKEFLLYSGTTSVRIVSFFRGEFQFRPNADELGSLEYAVGPVDVDGDGQLEFIKGQAFPSDYYTNLSAETIYLPYVYRWSKARGFYDVSKSHSGYYREVVIPNLEQRLRAEQGAQMRQTISRALDYLKNDLLAP